MKAQEPPKPEKPANLGETRKGLDALTNNRTETVLEKKLPGTINKTELERILAEAGFGKKRIETAKKLTKKAKITQTITVEKKLTQKINLKENIAEEWKAAGFETTNKITVENPSNMPWRLEIVAEIPKAIAKSAGEIKGYFSALKPDPIVQFALNVKEKSKGHIFWAVEKNIDGKTAGKIKAPIIVSLKEEPFISPSDITE